MSTIKDVAQKAAVSIATVSRVINRSSSVSPATVAQVEQAIQQVGYQISGNRRLSINQDNNAIGLMISNFNSPFYSLLIQGVEKVARRYNRRVIVVNGRYDAEYEEDAINCLISQGCRNIVAHCKAMSDEKLIRLANNEPGLVFINHYIEAIERQCVWLENSEGSYQATRHLLEQGHTRIAFLGCELDIDDKLSRLAGYKKALSEAGITPSPDWVEEVPFGEQGGASGAINLWNKGLPVTAIVAYNDFFAAAAMQVFSEHGVAVPDRISIVGFDDVLPQCYFTPKLTTIRSPIESMAMNATRISLEGPDHDISRQFQPLLVKRNSVAPYAG